MRNIGIIAAIALFAVAQFGCAPERSASGSKPIAPALRRLPAELKVRQRTTTRVPGSQGSLYLTIDDITRGQVMASLADRDGKPVLTATSLERGSAVTFKLGDVPYQLTMTEMDNSLSGDDYATFMVSSGAVKEPATETDVIERLLSTIKSAKGVVFIRNGKEHAAKEAAGHLRAKWKAAGSEITDVETFIDQIATKSSITDEPYRVRKPDGTEVAAADYLREQLQQVKSDR